MRAILLLTILAVVSVSPSFAQTVSSNSEVGCPVAEFESSTEG